MMAMGIVRKLKSVRKRFSSMWKIVGRVWQKAEDDDCRILASDITYDALFAIFPALLLLAGVLSLDGGRHGTLVSVLDAWSEFFPSQIFLVLRDYAKSITRSQSLYVLSVSALFSLWGASNAIFSVINGINRAYGLPKMQRYWTTRLATMFLVVAGIFLLVFSYDFYLMVQKHFTVLVARSMFEKIIGYLFSVMDVPIMLFIIFAVSSAVYYFAPRAKQRFRAVLPGSVFFTVSWWLLLMAVNYYFRVSRLFSTLYGTFGAAFVMLVWIYGVSLLLLLGGELNSALYDGDITPWPSGKKS
jgi:membrane protein